MRVRPVVVALVLGAVLVAGAAAAFRDAPSQAPGPPRGTVVIDTGDAEVIVRVEIASTGPQRERGLMHRTSLPPESGMVFRFPGPTSGGFWMKSTLIPLDIAFYNGRGTILRIMQMKPCQTDPCTIYTPGVTYRGALEVNAGAFRRWGVSAGDRIVVRRS